MDKIGNSGETQIFSTQVNVILILCMQTFTYNIKLESVI